MKSLTSALGMAGIARWVVALGLIGISLVLLTHLPHAPSSEGWYASAAFFPTVAIILVVAGGVSYLWQSSRSSAESSHVATDAAEDEIDASGTNPRLAAIAVLGLLAYQGLIMLLGFVVATLLFVVAGARLCSLDVKRSIVIGAVLSLVLYGVFVSLFKVGFPTPLLLEWITGG